MIDTFLGSLQNFITEIILFIPRVLLAIILWLIGRWLIEMFVNLLDKFQIERLKIDDTLRNLFKRIIVPIANVVLVLIILDTFGIGSNVVAAFLSGMTFTIAITLGLAFGRALEPEARNIVDRAKEGLESHRT